MNTQLQNLFRLLETQREQLTRQLHDLSSEQLNKRDGPKWSVAEILSHLITAERMSVLYIQKKIQGIEKVKDSGLWEELKTHLLKISQRLPGLKFRAPESVIQNTVLFRDLDSIAHEWDRVREELRLLLENIPDQHINRKIYRHALAGYLNIKQALIFLREHIHHHTPQIKKLVNKY